MPDHTQAVLTLSDVKIGATTIFPTGYGGVTSCQLYPPSVVCKINWVAVLAQPVFASSFT
ncbi:MAG TPA: hypothetical protein VKR42_04180 [Ktedonobacteraceae bacterium]|nr:hypothetical protein [Ktedonobacteraceae bacterium]